MEGATSSRWHMRALVLSAVTLLVSACAGIAGIDPPGQASLDSKPKANDDKDDDDSAKIDPKEVQAPPPVAKPDGGTNTPPPTTAPPPVIPPPGPTCVAPKVDIGGACQQSAQCCSNACRDDGFCAGGCDSGFDTCDVSKRSCCAGSWCLGFLGPFGEGVCQACIGPGQKANPDGAPPANSCCSKQLNQADKTKCL